MSPNEVPLLTVEVDGATLCAFHRDELPAEKNPSVALAPTRSEVVFRQPHAPAQVHSLSFEEGWAHFSVRVHEPLVCQADCVISDSSHFDVEAFGAVYGNTFYGEEPVSFDEAVG
jgi:hypothetical protein